MPKVVNELRSEFPLLWRMAEWMQADNGVMEIKAVEGWKSPTREWRKNMVATEMALSLLNDQEFEILACGDLEDQRKLFLRFHYIPGFEDTINSLFGEEDDTLRRAYRTPFE